MQAAAILGLAIAPATMQPQALAAAQAERFPNTLILLPYGNDGVGIPGPFIATLPADAKLFLLRPNATPPEAPAYILATLTADAASRAETAQSPGLFPRKNLF